VADFTILREESGLPFELVAQCDLVAYVEIERLSPWGNVGDEIVAMVSNYHSVERDGRWGLPYSEGPQDPRWQWKRGQLGVMQRVSATAHAQLIDV
jgi:hypothetical protein